MTKQITAKGGQNLSRVVTMYSGQNSFSLIFSIYIHYIISSIFKDYISAHSKNHE